MEQERGHDDNQNNIFDNLNTSLAVEEVADVLKSKDNITYLFELSGLIIRIFLTS